jgi:hypothetical protein
MIVTENHDINHVFRRTYFVILDSDLIIIKSGIHAVFKN